MEPVKALNRTTHCGTCTKFKVVNKNGWGNCAHMGQHNLLSSLFPCRFDPVRWYPKSGGALVADGD